MSRPTPRSALTIQCIAGGPLAVFTRTRKPDLNRSVPVSAAPSWGRDWDGEIILMKMP